MAANFNPIFTLSPNVGSGIWTASLTANVKSDGTGTIATDMVVVFTAGANGSFVQKLRATPNGSTAATATTATVLRVYRSTQTSGATTNANTWRLDEIACPAQTTDQTTIATNYLEIPLGFGMNANETMLISMHHAAAANTNWQFNVIGGNY